MAGQGDVVLTATVNGKTLHGTMRGVLYVPGLGTNLYSIGTATDAGLKVLFSEDAVCELKQKSEVPEAFKKFNAKMKNETGKVAKILRSDGGGEFCSKEF